MGRLAKLTERERAALRARGYRAVEVWVPDDSRPAYRVEAARQSAEAARVDAEDDVMDWVESVSSKDWDRL